MCILSSQLPTNMLLQRCYQTGQKCGMRIAVILLALLVWGIVGSGNVKSQPNSLHAFTWHEPPEDTNHLTHFSSLSAHNPSEIDYTLGQQEGENKLLARPEGRRALFPLQSSFYLLKDGWNPGRSNRNDRTIATTLAEDIDGEDRTYIQVDPLPYDLPQGNRYTLYIQTGDPSNVPLGKWEGIIEVQLDGSVSAGATTIPIHDGDGNPVSISGASAGDNVLSDFQSLWPTHAAAEMKAAMEEYVQGVVDVGAAIDAIIFDLETGVGAKIAHKHDPRWDDPAYGFEGENRSMKQYFEEESGFTIDDVIGKGGSSDEKLAWTALMSRRVVGNAAEEAYFEPVWEHFPDAHGSGYEKTGLTKESAEQWAMQTDGWTQYSPYVLGTHGSKPLYASMRSLTSMTLPGTTYRNEASPFATILWQTNYARAMYRDTEGKIQPWVTYPNLRDGYFINDTGSGPYYDEYLRHIMLATDDVPILYWNARDGGGGGASLDNDRRVDDLIGEINALTGGDYTLLSDGPIAWDTDHKSIVATEVQTQSGSSLYRITIPRLPHSASMPEAWQEGDPLMVDVVDDGVKVDEVTVQTGDVGAWYEGNSGLSFEFEHPPLENDLSSGAVAFDDPPWQGGTATENIDDPEGGSSAYRIDGQGKFYLDLDLEPNSVFTLSFWARRVSNNSMIKILSDHAFEDEGAGRQDRKDFTGSGLWADGQWHRTRMVFKTPEHGRIRITVNTGSLADLDLWRPMLHEGEIHGPYAEPGGAEITAQTIPLQEGWNIVSSSVAPTNPDLEAVLGDAISEVGLVKDEQGQIFSPGDGVNQIDSWNSQEAYLIYAEAATSFTIEGNAVDPTSAILLEQGWNLLPFFGATGMDVEVALDAIASHLVMVKDAAGNVYHPEYGINEIGQFEPGGGYKIYVNDTTTLNYPPPN